jgi:hypothetical protein
MVKSESGRAKWFWVHFTSFVQLNQKIRKLILNNPYCYAIIKFNFFYKQQSVKEAGITTT